MKAVLIFGLLIISLTSFAFEGEFKLLRQNLYDTSTIIYYVKGDLIRIEEYNINNRLIKSYLINQKDQKIYSLNSSKKMFKEIPYHQVKESISDQSIKIIKTENTKVINGIVCEQWRARNTSKNTEITYWVSPKNPVLPAKFLSLFSTSNNIIDFYMSIPENNGFTPFYIIERTLVRNERESIKISAITSKPLADNLFIVPSGYKKLGD